MLSDTTLFSADLAELFIARSWSGPSGLCSHTCNFLTLLRCKFIAASLSTLPAQGHRICIFVFFLSHFYLRRYPGMCTKAIKGLTMLSAMHMLIAKH